MPDTKWSELEGTLHHQFEGMYRKDGVTPMVHHSLRVGRALREAGEDDVTVFGGYCHDMLEDVPDIRIAEPHIQDRIITNLALRLLDDAGDAATAADLVRACSYSAAEEAVERSIGGRDGKLARKALACQRWLTGSLRVALVKQADVKDNRADMSRLSTSFQHDYLEWAAPLEAGLQLRIEGFRAAEAMSVAHRMRH